MKRSTTDGVLFVNVRTQSQDLLHCLVIADRSYVHRNCNAALDQRLLDLIPALLHHHYGGLEAALADCR